MRNSPAQRAPGGANVSTNTLYWICTSSRSNAAENFSPLLATSFSSAGCQLSLAILTPFSNLFSFLAFSSILFSGFSIWRPTISQPKYKCKYQLTSCLRRSYCSTIWISVFRLSSIFACCVSNAVPIYSFGRRRRRPSFLLGSATRLIVLHLLLSISSDSSRSSSAIQTTAQLSFIRVVLYQGH